MFVVEFNWMVCNAISGLSLLLDIKHEKNAVQKKRLLRGWADLESLKPAVLEYIQHVIDYGSLGIEKPQLYKAIEAIESGNIAEISEGLLSDLRDKAERCQADHLDEMKRTVEQGPIRFAIV